MRHYHTEGPFLCIKGTMMGWSVSPECNPEIVEVCSEMIIGDVVFLSHQDALFQELKRRGVPQAGLDRLWKSDFSEQPKPA